MKLEARGRPIKYRLKTGEEVTLRPGVPMDLPDQAATQLLKKAPDKVRMVTNTDKVTIESAAQNARHIFWETADGRIVGPAVPECLARDGDTFWIVTTFEGQPRWVSLDRLRSRKAFEQQAEVREVEPIYSL